MRKFTDVELDLAPKVAEIMGPWEPKDGDYMAVFETRGDLYDGPKAEVYDKPHVYLLHNSKEGRYYSYAGIHGCGGVFSEDPSYSCLPERYTWLPSVEDCLEFLRGRVDSIEIYSESYGRWSVYTEYRGTQGDSWGDTLKEALYRRVIAVGGKEDLS